MIGAELERAGVALELGAYADVADDAGGRPRAIVLAPSGRRLEVDRVLALPRLRGRPPSGVPADPDGFLPVDGLGRVDGAERVWAAGDGIAFPVKFGGLATEQADAVAADVAAVAGAAVTPAPFRPVLRGRLLTPRGTPQRFVRLDAGGAGGTGGGRRPRTVVAAGEDRRPLAGSVAGPARRRGGRRPSAARGHPRRAGRPAPRRTADCT